VPVVTRKSEFTIDVKVHFYRREDPGSILHGGDLDNRIKTLFDALRMPHSPDEITDAPADGESRRLYCLLEDDSLITSVAVEAHRLWQPASEGRGDTDVRLAVHVDIGSRDD
jgi:hypothetical protein